MVLDDVFVLFFHDYSCDVGLYRPHRLQLLSFLPQLVEAEEVVLETLSLETLSE